MRVLWRSLKPVLKSIQPAFQVGIIVLPLGRLDVFVHPLYWSLFSVRLDKIDGIQDERFVGCGPVSFHWERYDTKYWVDLARDLDEED